MSPSKEVRAFLKARLLEESPHFRAWPDGFNRDNIPSTILNRSYFMRIINPLNITTQGRLVDDQIRVDLELFYKGYRDVQTALDESMDEAYCIKLRASNPIHRGDSIKEVTCGSIISEQIVSNDNAIIIGMTFNFRVMYEVI